MDLAISLETGDVVFENGKTLVVSEAGKNVAQRLHIMLHTFAGEWYLNTEYGIPYFQSILGKKVSRQAIDLIFQQRILSEDGVQEIVEFTSNLSNSRVYTMSFKVRAEGLVVALNVEVGV